MKKSIGLILVSALVFGVFFDVTRRNYGIIFLTLMEATACKNIPGGEMR